MPFRAPRMTYAPRCFEVWEHVYAFTVVEAPFDVVEPLAAGVIRARQGPSGALPGERRLPIMALDHMQKDAAAGKDVLGASLIFEGNLIFSPAEAPQLTVIEHPFDEVSTASFPQDLSRVMPDTRLITFDSTLESTVRALHGYLARRGDTVERHAYLSRGYQTRGWHWDESGTPLPFEDKARLGKKRIWERLDRPGVFEAAARLGLSLENTLFMHCPSQG